jgi:hypothetical protein
LLQNLQNFRGIPLAWFPDEQVHVFGHNYISDQNKGVPCANFVKNPHEAISRADRAEIGAPPVTTEGDKMQVAASVESLQWMARDFHRSRAKVRIRTLNPEGCGTHAQSLRQLVAE